MIKEILIFLNFKNLIFNFLKKKKNKHIFLKKKKKELQIILFYYLKLENTFVQCSE